MLPCPSPESRSRGRDVCSRLPRHGLGVLGLRYPERAPQLRVPIHRSTIAKVQRTQPREL